MRRGAPTRTADDWEEAALDVIAARGVEALAIPDLARTLGVTKGSFYWHFKSLDDLTSRAVQRWQAADNDTLANVRRIENPAARLRALFTEAVTAERAPGLYLALALSPRFAAVLEKVSAARLRLLADCYRELGLDRRAAQHRALLAYSAYIGWLYLRGGKVPGIRRHDIDEYLNEAAAVLLRR